MGRDQPTHSEFSQASDSRWGHFLPSLVDIGQAAFAASFLPRAQGTNHPSPLPQTRMAKQHTNGNQNGNSKKNGKESSRRRDHIVDRFADEIIAGKDATQAALVINPKLKHGSAKQKGYRLMQDPRVQERIRERFADAASLTSDEVIGTLAAHMRVDASDFVEILNPQLAEEMRKKKVGHLIQEIEIREEKISYGDTARKVRDLAKEMEKCGASLNDEAITALLAAAAPVSRTVRVRFHHSQAAAGKLSKLMGLEEAGRERDRDAKMRARILAACKKLADKWDRPLEQVLAEYAETVPEHARFIGAEYLGKVG